MAGKRKRNGRVMSIPAGVGFGVCVSYLVTLAGAAMVAWLVLSERIGEENIGWGSMIVLLLASAIGTVTAWRSIRHKRWMVTGLAAAGYYIALLVTALAFGGGFTGMGTTAVTVALGGGIVQIPALFGGGSGAHRHKIKAFR